MSDITDRIWKRFSDLTEVEIPDEVSTVARQCVIDWYGCAIAGSGEPLAAMLRDELGAGPGPASVIGAGTNTGAMQAALINGATGHALDFDDTHSSMGGHPTVPVYPAVLALAQEQDRTAGELLTAFVIGHEVECLIGSAMGAEHYAKGWHQTSTMGVFGAAAGCSWLLDLDSEGFGHAMGMAASSASGLKANFGTMTKPLHAGQAAERGLLAAKLAARGFTANAGAIDGKQGLAQAAGSGYLDMDRFERFVDDWLIPRTLFKFHAACYLTHAGIEATKSLLLPRDEVSQVALAVNPSILDVCGITEPRTGLEAKFSLRGTQALLLAGVDTSAVATFEDGPINRADVQALLSRITVETDETLSTMQTRSLVSSSAGEREAFHDAGVPESDISRQGDRVLEKFFALAEPVVGQSRAQRLIETIDALESIPVL